MNNDQLVIKLAKFSKKSILYDSFSYKTFYRTILELQREDQSTYMYC